jgi:hypothetical protein
MAAGAINGANISKAGNILLIDFVILFNCGVFLFIATSICD